MRIVLTVLMLLMATGAHAQQTAYVVDKASYGLIGVDIVGINIDGNTNTEEVLLLDVNMSSITFNMWQVAAVQPNGTLCRGPWFQLAEMPGPPRNEFVWARVEWLRGITRYTVQTQDRYAVRYFDMPKC